MRSFHGPILFCLLYPGFPELARISHAPRRRAGACGSWDQDGTRWRMVALVLLKRLSSERRTVTDDPIGVQGRLHPLAPAYAAGGRRGRKGSRRPRSVKAAAALGLTIPPMIVQE
jgi:hypothetical protein